MHVASAAQTDLKQALNCLVAAFAKDPITSFLLESGPNYSGRLTQFFSLLMRARIALEMPVLVVRDPAGIHGAAMGYTTADLSWPVEIEDEWNRFALAVPGLRDRIALYEEVAEKYRPPQPHYYLGVIGVDPARHGLGIGARLLKSFSHLSASDPLSNGVYLETANPLNVPFYEHAGFAVLGQGSLSGANLWCMFQKHGQRPDA